MLDRDKERESRDKFQESEPEKFIELSRLVDIAIHGIEYCQDLDSCESYQICGDDSCMCVRSVLPSLDHYLLYYKLRKIILKNKILMDLEQENHK